MTEPSPVTGKIASTMPAVTQSAKGHVSLIDGISLTAAGIVYAAVVTVVGVAVARARWWVVLIYVVAALGLLAWDLVRPRRVLRATQRVIVQADEQARRDGW